MSSYIFPAYEPHRYGPGPAAAARTYGGALNRTPRPAVGPSRSEIVFRSRTSRALSVGIVLLLVVGVFGVAGLGRAVQVSGVVTDASSTLSVTAASGFKFVSATYQGLPTNTTINVTFLDADSLAHTFSILNRSGVRIPDSTQTGALDQLFATYGALVDLNVTGAGDKVTGSFTSPATKGWYEFVCLEAGHFQQGMYGFIAFGENLPSNLTVSAPSTGPGAGVFIISGTIVTLVVIALVLGFVVGQRRGAEHEMPPERLGYPEPLAGTPEPLPPPTGGAPPTG